MRKGILCVVAALLAGHTLVHAQDGSAARTTLPGTIPESPKAADLAKPSLGCPEVANCLQNCCEPPLRVWVNADYLLWWTKGAPVNTPLVTTGSLTDIPPGALGQPGTQVLFGNQPIGFGALSGMRLGGGVGLTDSVDLEGNYLLLGRGASHFHAASDANGNPLITRPFFNNQLFLQDSLGTSDPDPAVGPWAGSTSVTAYSQLQGWELNLASRGRVNDRLTIVWLAGFRSLNLNEDLIIQDSIVPLVPATLNVGTLPANPPSTISDIDSFHTSNTFYGGQFGGRAEWRSNRLTVSLLGKIAFGVNQQIAIVDGSTTLNTPGAAPVTLPGGVLALPSNMGRYYKSAFSVVPEFGLNLSWNLTPRLKATAGYTFMYWTQVARPGNQIDNTLNPGLIPTSQVFGNGLGANRPTFTFHESDYWAQGLNLGLIFQF